MKNYILIFLVLALSIAIIPGCYIDEQSLHGNWRATLLYENNQPLTVALDSVFLYFSPAGKYEFSTIGYYRESGTYRTSMHFLLLTDTTSETNREHILKILSLSPDTLKLRMEENEKEQILILKKQ